MKKNVATLHNEVPSTADKVTPTAVAGGPLVPIPNQPRTYRPRHVPLWNNFITICGLFVVAGATLLLLTFGLFTLVTRTVNPYVDIVGYLVLPGILVLGVLIVPFGILIKSWRLRRRSPERALAFRFPRIDLNDPAQRRVAKLVLLGMFTLLPVLAVSSYQGYHYTDSSDFCAKACHAAMEPQATTYEYSAHARVTCAECHIGEGAGWFVRSKLSGTRQVLAMWQDTYSRPIPPAISHLRPARETCEHCHWPRKFFGAQLKRIVTFGSDEKNTRREIDMLLKIGGGDRTTGRAEGIHLHMALEGRVEYVTTDRKLQDIPWVKLIDAAGNETIYRSDGKPSSDPKPEGQSRKLDCMDCHNRPAHKFRSPQRALDVFLDIGRIDASLPFIKREAASVLSRAYADKETALAQIGLSLSGFYKEHYAQDWESRKAAVFHAIDEVRAIYSQNVFPRMKVDWRTYPDNIGHKVSSGCFRCHDGNHVNRDGEPISHACSTCHTFLNPVKKNGEGAVIEEGEFVHPTPLEGVHATLRCDQCHTGGISKLPTCAGCHTVQSEFRAGTSADFASFNIPADPMASMVDCDGCHDLSQPTTIETIDLACMDCHDDEERFEGMLASWRREVDEAYENLGGRLDAEGERLLQSLRDAGPMHNIEATRTILRSLAPTTDSSEKP